MYSEVMRWRALGTYRFWSAWVFLTLGWSAGVGLALKAIRHNSSCEPLSVMPLNQLFPTFLSVPLRILEVIPYGLYESGLMFAFFAAVALLIPMALLPNGVVQRMENPFTVGLATLGVGVIAWSVELSLAFSRHILPSLVCSN